MKKTFIILLLNFLFIEFSFGGNTEIDKFKDDIILIKKTEDSFMGKISRTYSDSSNIKLNYTLDKETVDKIQNFKVETPFGIKKFKKEENPKYLIYGKNNEDEEFFISPREFIEFYRDRDNSYKTDIEAYDTNPKKYYGYLFLKNGYGAIRRSKGFNDIFWPYNYVIEVNAENSEGIIYNPYGKETINAKIQKYISFFILYLYLFWIVLFINAEIKRRNQK